jgi:vacuolar-type H+-ATPase subunit I/STV1
MKFGLNYKMLVYWLMGNAVVTIFFGLFLAAICLFPGWVPALRTLLAEGTLATFLPYLIFILIVTSLVSLAFYYDSRGR